MRFHVRAATANDAAVLGDLVARLLCDLVGHNRTVDPLDLADTAQTLLAHPDDFWAFLAERDDGRPVGAITVSRSAALYAGGAYGVIEELYVDPDHRSVGVGAALIRSATELACERGWRRLETSAPEGQDWARGVAFYEREGFVPNSSGVRLKLTLC